MFYLRFKGNVFTAIFNTLAVISTIVFGIISALSIRQVLIDNTVFMTAIHGIFLNTYFLSSGGYLGIFAIYRLLTLIFEENFDKSP